MKSTIKIMLVEDDKNLSLILKAFLTTKGYHTILCLMVMKRWNISTKRDMTL